jgi:hypothetical protein
MAPYLSTNSRGKSNGILEIVSCGATRGVFLLYCRWNGSLRLLTANRWQIKAPAAVIFSTTHHGGSQHIPELRHRHLPDVFAT